MTEVAQDLNNEITASPAGEVVSPSQEAETIATSEAPAASTEDQELADLQAKIDTARTPEEKEAARQGYQRRQEEKRVRELETKNRDLELKLAREQAQREVLERLGVRPEQQAAQPVPEPQIPPPVLPPRPDASQWTDQDGYEDLDKKTEILADWRAECKFAERDHQLQTETAKQQLQANMQKANDFIGRVVEAHPDFAELMRSSARPSETVSKVLVNMDTENQKVAADLAYHLVKNPAEFNRINTMPPEMAAVTLGRLAERLSLPPVQPKKVSEAPSPAKPVTSTETLETFDPEKCDMDTYGRHHPACPSWLK